MSKESDQRLELKIDSLIVEVKAVREEVKAAQKLNEGLLICLFIAAVAVAFSFFKTNFFFYFPFTK